MKKILFEDACILSAIKSARFLVKVLPFGVSLAFARWLGGVVCLLTKRSRIARKNLRMVFATEKSPEELDRLAKRSIQNLAMAAVEMLRIPDLTAADIGRRFHLDGWENFEPYLRRGQGVIFLTGHFGAWELINIVGALSGYPVTALARVQKHPRSDAFLNDLRRSKGSRIIYKGIPVREILKALKNGQPVGILSDQDGGRSGCFVEFFGRLSSTPPGAAIFSLRTGAPIFPVFIDREAGDCHRIAVEKPLTFPPEDLPSEQAVAFVLQQFARALEARVRRAPDQWLWAHRRWKSSPDRRVLVLSDGKAGHVNQSLAVCDAIRRERKSHGADEQRITSSLIEVHFKHKGSQRALRALSLLLRGHLPFRRFWMKRILTEECYKALAGSYADVVISCGSSLIDVNLWMKRENDARSVVVMKPALPHTHFDAVIAPKHDGLTPHPGVFTTEGALSSLSASDLEVEGGVLAAELGLAEAGKRIGVLVGGDTAGLRFEAAEFQDLLGRISETAGRAGARLLLTTSRRTPSWADEWLKRSFTDRGRCPLLLIASEANRRGIVAGILGLSDALVVTGESMSMVSEAVSTGKPVIVIRPWGPQKQKKKYEQYLGHLEREGRLSVCGKDTLRSRLEKALSGEWAATNDYRLREEAVLSGAARRVIS